MSVVRVQASAFDVGSDVTMQHSFHPVARVFFKSGNKEYRLLNLVKKWKNQ